MGENIPKLPKIYLMAIKYTKCRKIDLTAIKIPTSFIARLSKIYPNWDFWFENIPSGNPAYRRKSAQSGRTGSD
jgi:hypothetical protein